MEDFEINRVKRLGGKKIRWCGQGYCERKMALSQDVEECVHSFRRSRMAWSEEGGGCGLKKEEGVVSEEFLRNYNGVATVTEKAGGCGQCVCDSMRVWS